MCLLNKNILGVQFAYNTAMCRYMQCTDFLKNISDIILHFGGEVFASFSHEAQMLEMFLAKLDQIN